MSEKVKLSKDGSSIDFVASESLPTSLKKFRQSPEIEGFYRFIYENDLQREAFEILERIVMHRKAKKSAEKAAVKEATKAAKDAEKVKVVAPAPAPKVITREGGAKPKDAKHAPAKVEMKHATKPVAKTAPSHGHGHAKPVVKAAAAKPAAKAAHAKPAAKPASKAKGKK